MPDDRAPHHFFTAPLRHSRLPYHLPDGFPGHGEVVRRPGKTSRQSCVGILEVRKVNVYFPLQPAQSLYPLIAAAVVHHRHRQLRGEGRENGGQKLGGGHQINIFRAPGDQILKNPPQSGAVRGRPHRPTADGGVLTVFAPQCTAAEEHRAAAAAPRKGRLLPFVEHGFGHQRGIRTAAEALFPGSSVHPAPSGAEVTVRIIHIFHILWVYDSSFQELSQVPALPLAGFVVDYNINKCKMNVSAMRTVKEKSNGNPFRFNPGDSRHD